MRQVMDMRDIGLHALDDLIGDFADRVACIGISKTSGMAIGVVDRDDPNSVVKLVSEP